MNSERKSGTDIAQTLGLGQDSGRSGYWKRWVIVCLLVLIALGAAVLWNNADKKNSTRYKTLEVRRGDLTVTVTATGTLQPINQVDVGVEVSGTVQSVEADFNDHVKAGQVLARLDTSKFTAQVLQAKAALASTRAKVSRARADVRLVKIKLSQFQQARKSSGGKVPSQVEMDSAETALALAEADEASALADVSRAGAELYFNNTDLSKSIIRSPIEGIVLLRRVEPGQTVAASLQTPVLFTIAEDLGRMELHVDVDEADVGKVKAGQSGTFTVDAFPDRRFQARVVEVRFSPKTVEGVVTYETVLSVENPGMALMPGMTATADIVVKQEKDALLIPNAALRFSPPVVDLKGAGEKKRGLLGALIPHRRSHSRSDQEKKPLKKGGQRLVWTLQNNELVSIPITTKETDGRMTEVVSGDVRPGLELIIDVEVRKNE